MYCQSNQNRLMRNKAKSLKHLPSTPPFAPVFLYVLLPLRNTRRQGMGVVVSSSRVVSTTPSSLRSFPFPVCGPIHRRQFSTNFSNRLQFSMNSSSVGPFHRGQSFSSSGCSSVGPPQAHRFCQEPAPAWAPFPCGHISCQKPTPAGSQPPLTIHLL